MAPGILYVTMQPKPTLPPTQFEDWYNNEHGPDRLRVPFIPNGFRYRAVDLPEKNAGTQQKPEWMACYDITDSDLMTTEIYMRLRTPEVKSEREISTMKEIWVNRKLFDFVSQKVNSENYVELEDMANFDKNDEGNTLVSVMFVVDSAEKSKVEQWLDETEIPRIEKLNGWRRSRRYITAANEPRKDGKLEYLTVHEFAPSTNPQSLDITTSNVPTTLHEEAVRIYSLYYTFGPGARHLSSISSWSSKDKTATTIPSTSPDFGSAIESYITTSDGVSIPYRIEGSSTPTAPVIVLSNCVMTTWGIWDSFVSSFFSHPSNQQYRILRYNSRGRYRQTGTQPVTVSLLASDIIALLDALRIPRAHCLIGVSLGGATTLCAALAYPTRITSFISCDTSAKSPAGNAKTWGDRIAISEKENTLAFIPPQPFSPAESEPVVGEQLSEVTVRRWFVPASYDDDAIRSRIAAVKHMAYHNSLEGFRNGVHALFDYDLTEQMERSEKKAAFVVGAGDGVLPKGMEAMSKAFGSKSEGGGKTGAKFFVVDGAGHLPMVERPEEVARFVTGFLDE